MYLFNKHPHPLNFAFAGRAGGGSITVGRAALELRATALGDDMYHIEIRNPSVWPRDDRAVCLPAHSSTAAAPRDATRLEITPQAGMTLRSRRGRRWLTAADRHWFGTSGSAWMFRFDRTPQMRFYGLGEKHTPFERSGRAFTFWNVDAWADHPSEQTRSGDYDPDYISIPYLIIRKGNTYIGLLLDCPHAAMISTADDADLSGFLRSASSYPPSIVLGAEDGIPSLYLLCGPSLPALTRKFQRLTGTTPLPPLWALGYHQSRWGYAGQEDLLRLADRFAELSFPVDGLWLDIDYMDGYRVFTFDRRHMPRPAAVTAELARRGLRVVPILDPGIKREEGYPVYESGRRQQLFCLNPAGGEFVGMVWPGLSVFPDFSLPATRRWWADQARQFFELGFAGAWIDMNDPSTGPVDCHSMLFDRGRARHGAYHNQYGMLMARATAEGWQAARPELRPFVLSRSGCTGSQRYAAHWTGDNFSNYRHLHRSIAKSLNLALSGIPFNGPDVGGFGGDCSEDLLIDWFKAAFLFPFLRNHAVHESRSQEPWAYSRRALSIIRRFVRLRYTLMPYLYNLFVEQELSGEAILRPLFYDCADRPALPLGGIDDQFMVGPSIMQAPFLNERGRTRTLALPPGRWLSGASGRWIDGGRRLSVRRDKSTTPLFLREGGLIPFQPGVRRDNRSNLNEIGLLCCLSRHFAGKARLLYRADDGESLAYRQGRRSEIEITARVRHNNLHLKLRALQAGYGEVRVTPYTLDPYAAVFIEQNGSRRALAPTAQRLQLTGPALACTRWR